MDGAAAMDAALDGARFDAVILDVMMPGEDGLSACRRLAERRGPAIIMLSAAGEDIDRILGLELGADDYLSKPCNPRELLARVKAVLRRREREGAAARPRGAHFVFAGFQLDVARRQLQAPSGVTVLLTSGELSLLTAFVENPRRVLSRELIFERVWHYDFGPHSKALDVYIGYLRRKTEAAGEARLVHTVRGVGYTLRAP